MTHFILTTAMVGAFAFSTTALAAPVELSSAIKWQVQAMVPDTNFDNLTNAQYARIVSLFSNGKNLRSGNNPVGALKAILNAQ